LITEVGFQHLADQRLAAAARCRLQRQWNNFNALPGREKIIPKEIDTDKR